jgi:TRAP-type uncharacterized transport system fused permease subunit
VGMAFYAGAAIAGSDTMKTGWAAWRIALAGFLLPFMFVYNPALLLMGQTGEAVLASVTAVIGAGCLAAAVVGHIRTSLSWFERVMVLAAAFLLIKPGLTTDIIGVVLLVAAVLMSARRAKTAPSAGSGGC